MACLGFSPAIMCTSPPLSFFNCLLAHILTRITVQAVSDSCNAHKITLKTSDKHIFLPPQDVIFSTLFLLLLKLLLECCENLCRELGANYVFFSALMLT